jgi:hypothetical protein
MPKPIMLPEFQCSKGHERVEWRRTGGYVERDHKGRVLRVNDYRCWYCGKRIDETAPWPGLILP